MIYFINKTDFLISFWRKIGILIILTPIFFIDGTFVNSYFPYGQQVLSILTICAFLVFYKRARSRVKKIYLYVLLFSPLVEFTMSLFFNMYSYRLNNVPIYTFFMHAICIGRLFEFCSEKTIKANKNTLLLLLYLFLICHSITYLVLFNDIFGFVMFLGIIILCLLRPKYQLFFLTYHLIIAFAELSGVYFQAWYWPELAFNYFENLPSNNPPSGISLFYYLLELGAFIFYILFNKKSWNRFKKINYKRFANNV